MNCLKQLQRFFSGIIAVTFFVTNTLTPFPVAHAANVEFPALISSFTIPAEFGKVTDSVKGSEGGSLLIHIQEAHANYDAQKNIKNILDYLSKNYGIRLILLEGAGNKLTPELFNFFPQEPGLQQAINEKLMQAGELTGAETFMISEGNDQNAEAWGVEKAEAYAKNREAFKRVFEGRELVQDFLETFYRQWQTYASFLMSKPLKEFLAREAAFEEGRLPLVDWTVSLKMAAVRYLKLDLDNVLEQKDWPVLVRYFRLKAINPKIDEAKVDAEKKAFLREIRKSVTRFSETGDRKTNALNESLLKEVEQIFEQANTQNFPAYKVRFVFERLLDQLPKDFSFDPYPNLRLYLQQTILLSELQGEALQDEIKNLTGKLTACLLKTEKDRQFVGVLNDFRLIKKLFELELNRGEYQTILSNKITLEKLLRELQAQDPKAKGQRRNPSSKFLRLQSLYGTAIRFYEGAIERENGMMKQAFTRMQERKQTKAVLITGGFHTEGLKEKALRAGSSYIEITPRIGEVRPEDEKNYLNALLGGNFGATRNAQRKIQNETVKPKTLQIERNDLAPIPVFDTAFPQEVEPGFWRRTLANRLAHIREIVLDTIISFRGHSTSHIAAVDAGLRNFIVSATTARKVSTGLQPAVARSEMRDDQDHEKLQNTHETQTNVAPTPGATVFKSPVNPARIVTRSEIRLRLDPRDVLRSAHPFIDGLDLLRAFALMVFGKMSPEYYYAKEEFNRILGAEAVPEAFFLDFHKILQRKLGGRFDEQRFEEAVVRIKEEDVSRIAAKGTASQKTRLKGLLLNQAKYYFESVQGFGLAIKDLSSPTSEAIQEAEEQHNQMLFASIQAADALLFLGANDVVETLTALARNGLIAHRQEVEHEKSLKKIEELKDQKLFAEAAALQRTADSTYEAIRRWIAMEKELLKVAANLGKTLNSGEPGYLAANGLLIDLMLDHEASGEGYFWLRQQAAARLKDFDNPQTVQALERASNPSLPEAQRPKESTMFMTANLEAANPNTMSIQLLVGESLMYLHRVRTFKALRDHAQAFTSGDEFEQKKFRHARLIGIKDALASPEVSQENRLLLLRRLAALQDPEGAFAANELFDDLEEMVAGKGDEIFASDAQGQLLKDPEVQAAALAAYKRIAMAVYEKLNVNPKLQREFESEIEKASPRDPAAFRRLAEEVHIVMGNLHRLKDLKSFEEGKAYLDMRRKIIIQSGGGASIAMAGVCDRITTDRARADISPTDDGGGTALSRGDQAVRFHINAGAGGDPTRFDTEAAIMEKAPAALVTSQLLGKRFGAGSGTFSFELNQLRDDLYKKARQIGQEEAFDRVYKKVQEIAKVVDQMGIPTSHNSVQNLVFDGLRFLTQGHGDEFMNPDGVYAALIEFRELVGSEGFAVLDTPYGNVMTVTSFDGQEWIGQDFFSHTPNGPQRGRQSRVARMKDVSLYYPEISVRSRTKDGVLHAKMILSGLSSWGTSLGVLFKNPVLVKAMKENVKAVKMLLTNPVLDDETRGMSWAEATFDFLRHMAGYPINKLWNVVIANKNNNLDVPVDTARPQWETQRAVHEGIFGGYAGPNISTTADIQRANKMGMKVDAHHNWTQVKMKPRRDNPDLFIPQVAAIPELLAEVLWTQMGPELQRELTPPQIVLLMQKSRELETLLASVGLNWQAFGFESAHELFFHPEMQRELFEWVMGGKVPAWIAVKRPDETWFQCVLRQSIEGVTGREVPSREIGIDSTVTLREEDGVTVNVRFLSQEETRAAFHESRIEIEDDADKLLEEETQRLGKLDFSEYKKNGTTTILLPNELLGAGRMTQRKVEHLEAVLKFNLAKIDRLRASGFDPAAANAIQMEHAVQFEYLKNLANELAAQKKAMEKGKGQLDVEMDQYLKFLGEMSVAVPYQRFLRRAQRDGRAPVVNTDMDGSMTGAGTPMNTPMAHDFTDFARDPDITKHFLTGQDYLGPYRQVVEPLQQIERQLDWIAFRTGVPRSSSGMSRLFRNMSLGACAGNAIFVYNEAQNGYTRRNQNGILEKEADLVELAARLTMPKINYPVQGHQVEFREPEMVKSPDGTWRVLSDASAAFFIGGRDDQRRSFDPQPKAVMRKIHIHKYQLLLTNPKEMLKQVAVFAALGKNAEWVLTIADEINGRPVERRVTVLEDQKERILALFEKNRKQWAEHPDQVKPIQGSGQAGGATTEDYAPHDKAYGVSFALKSVAFNKMPAINGRLTRMAMLGDEMAAVPVQDPETDQMILSEGNDFSVAKDPPAEIDLLVHTGTWGNSETLLPNTVRSFDARGVEPFLTIKGIANASRATTQGPFYQHVNGSLSESPDLLKALGVTRASELNEAQAFEGLQLIHRTGTRNDTARSEMRETGQTAVVATPELPGLTLGIPLDIGSERRGTAIVEFGALKKAARLLEPLKGSFGMGRVYPYNSLFATGDISSKVHQVPNKGEHFLISGNGKTTVMVRGYETKSHELDGLTLRDGANNFSIISMLKLNPRLSDSEAGPGTVEQTEKDIRTFNEKAHGLGIKTMADFIPWLAPDAINEENLDWTFYEKRTAEENRYFCSLPEKEKQSYINNLLREKRGAFFVRRIGEGDNEGVVLIRHFPGMGNNNYNADQVLLNIYSPGVRDYYKQSLRFLKKLGFDAVRGDMGSYLLKKNLSGFFAAAGVKPGTMPEGDPLHEILQDASMEAVFEAYDPDDQETLIEAGAPSPIAVYNNSLFKILLEFSNNPFVEADKIGKTIEEVLLYGVRHPGTKKRFLLYPTNFDQNSLNAMAHYPEDLGKGFSVAGVLALSFVTAYLAKDLGVLLMLRDVLGQGGDVRPIVGGDIMDRHAVLHGEHAKPFVNTAEELVARTDIEKLERAIREAPAAKFKRELMAAVKGSKQNFIRLLDNANLDRVVSLGWRTEKGEWVVFAVNLRPRQGPMDLRFVEFPVPAGENVPPEGWEAKDAITGERLSIVKEHVDGKEFPRISDLSFKDADYRLIVLAPKDGSDRSAMRSEIRNFKIERMVHIAYEMAPFFEVGGVKDVLRELVPAFKRAHKGVNVSVILPAHKSIWNSGLPIEEVRSFEIRTSLGNVKFTIFKTELENVTVYFIGNPDYFQEGYDETKADTFWEATTFSRAAVEAMDILGLHPDIVQAHDAQTALVIPFMRFAKERQFFDTATVYTIHNLGVAYQIRYPMKEKRHQLVALGIPAKELDPMGGLEFYGQVNLAKAGVVFSDKITTVGPDFRNYTLTPEGGFELQDVLRARSGDYVGIMNALDTNLWNPAEPFGIYNSYSADDLGPKRSNKESFLSRRGFEMDLAAPLIVAASRIREQKGMDWVLGASRRILRSRSEGGLGALLSVVGTGDAYLENEFSDLETEAPGRFKFLPLMGRKIVLETLSAADIGLVPSRFEPAGMIQQQMKRYGVVPVVRATGGLLSTVEDPDESPGQGTGFRFGYLERLTQTDMERVDLSKDLYLATARAANLYSYAPEGFTTMQKRAMKSVRSWDEVIPEYMEVYKGALANRFAFTGRSEMRTDKGGTQKFKHELKELHYILEGIIKGNAEGFQYLAEEPLEVVNHYKRLAITHLDSVQVESTAALRGIIPVVQAFVKGYQTHVGRLREKNPSKNLAPLPFFLSGVNLEGSETLSLSAFLEQQGFSMKGLKGSEVYVRLKDYGFHMSVTIPKMGPFNPDMLDRPFRSRNVRSMSSIEAIWAKKASRSEMRQAESPQNPAKSEKEPSWVEANTPRLAKYHVYSRQWECGLPMDLLEKIEKLYSAYEAGEISQVTLTGGLGALMPDLFEAWTAIGMNVTGIHPLWNFIKNKPLKGLDEKGVRKLLGKIAKEQMEDTGIKFDVEQNVSGNPRKVSFRVYKTQSMVHKAPQYYLDAYTTRPDGQEEPAFLEVYDDEGKREIDMAFFRDASERLVQVLENDPNPSKVVLLDHEVFVSLPIRYLKKAIRVTLNHTVFRPGLFEAWEGFFELLNFPEWLRSTIVHDGKISIADFTAEVFHLITGVNLVEHLPALLKNIFRVAWHRVIGFYDQAKKIRSTNGIFLPRWQSPARRTLIQRYKEKLQIPKPENRLPAEANDRQFYAELNKHSDLREQFKAQNEWVSAGDVVTLLTWLRETRGFKDAYDWLGNTFEGYKKQHDMDDVRLTEHLKEMQALLQKAVRENLPEDWERLETEFGEARDAVLADPVVANVRRFVAYKGPDKYEEILAVTAQKAAKEAGIEDEMKDKRPFDGRFQAWKTNHDRAGFEALRARLKGQPAVEELRKEICRVLIGGRTFDLKEAHDRFLYIKFLSELFGLEDRIATLEDYTYYEARIIFRGTQGAVMLSDEDLEASATSMMKDTANSGEVVGPYAGSNPEVWVIRDKGTGKIVEVLNEKGEPNTKIITQDILRDKLRKGEWEILNGVFVAYDDGEKSMQEGGGRRPSARSLVEALKEVKRLRSDPKTRRERMYCAVSNSWKVDMVTGQAMGHAYLLENTLKEIEERNAMFDQLQFGASDYAIPMKASDFGWKTDNPFYKHSAKGLGLFGMFRSFRELKTWQQKTPQRPSGDPSTRGLEALNSLRHHAYHGDIFKYLRKNVLDHLSPGLQPFKEKIESLAAKAEAADDKEMISLSLQAMDLTEMLLVRMAGDWFERYMKAAPAEAELLRNELTQGVGEDYQPWAEYIVRYLDGHSDARSLRTRENKIRSFVFAPKGRRPVMVNLNVGAPAHRETDASFQGLKARTQVLIDERTFRQLIGDAPKVKFVQLREPKFGNHYRAYAKEELASEVGVGIPMPIGIEVIEWVPARLTQSHVYSPSAMASLKRSIREKSEDPELYLTETLIAVGQQEPSAMASLKQLIREARTDYEPSEGRVPFHQLFDQLAVLTSFDRKNAAELFGENLKPLMTLIGLFRPDLLRTSQASSWDPEFFPKINRAIEEMKAAFGDDRTDTRRHNYYVIDSSHQGSLVLAKKNAKGDVFVTAFQFAANNLDAASDGKISTKAGGGLTRVIEQGGRYRVRDMLMDEDYGERDDLLQGWIIRTPFVGNEDRVQLLHLKSSQAQRSEMRAENAWPQYEAQKLAVIGTGFVGATKAILLVTDWGHDVIAVDVQPQIVEKLSNGKLTFHANDLQELLTEGLGTGRLKFTTDYAQAIEGREIIFLAVQTPQSETGHANINYLKDSVREIARLIHPGESKILIGKSTAPPRDTVAALKAVVVEEFQRREAAGEDLQGTTIHFAWEPEFLREGKEVEDDRGVAGRVVIGADTPAIAATIQGLYAHANPDPGHARRNVPIVLTDLTSAQLVKYAANGYRALKISYINFISWLTEELHLDINRVAHDIATQKDSEEEDRRIGYAFLCAGLGFGGSCFPKDLAAAVQIARGLNVLPGLVLDALAVNELQWKRFVEKRVIPQLQNVQGKTIVVLGASFKPGTDDIREARAVKIIEKLLEHGARIRVYDPVAVERLRNPQTGPFKDDTAIEYYSKLADLNAMLEDAAAVILATEWPDFNGIDFNHLRLRFLGQGKKLPPIFDGRNFFNERKVNDPRLIRELQRDFPDLEEKDLKFPYFNIGHGETRGAPRVAHDEFVERVRESFLALRISYINMIAEIAERVGANIRDVQQGLGLDFAVGEAYLAPGIGWGGNKLSAGIEALEGYAAQSLSKQLLQEFQRIRRSLQQKFGFPAEAIRQEASPVPFITTVRQINDQQIALYLEKARNAAGGDLRGKVIAVLGLAYKPGEYTTYQSRALNLIEALLKEGAIVRATDADPQAVSNARRELDEMHVPHSENLSFILGGRSAQENAREAVRDSELQFLVTASSAFANVKPIFFDEKGNEVAKNSRLVDGRHFYDPADLERQGIEYLAVGVRSSSEKSAIPARSEVRKNIKMFRREGVPGEAVKVTLGNLSFQVAPDFGAHLLSFEVDGSEQFHQSYKGGAGILNIERTGSWLMAPWVQGAFFPENKETVVGDRVIDWNQAPVKWKQVPGGWIANHGIARQPVGWNVISETDSGLRFGLRLEDVPGMDAYFHGLQFVRTVELQTFSRFNRLSIGFEAENNSDHDILFAAGEHLIVDAPKRESTFAMIPASLYLAKDALGMPLPQEPAATITALDFSIGKLLENGLDAALTGLTPSHDEGAVSFLILDHEKRVRVTQSEMYQHFGLWAPADMPRAIGFEPLSSGLDVYRRAMIRGWNPLLVGRNGGTKSGLITLDVYKDSDSRSEMRDRKSEDQALTREKREFRQRTQPGAHQTKPSRSGIRAGKPTGIERVLIVDDSENDRILNQDLLRKWAAAYGKELKIQEASSAEEALEILAGQQAAGETPDLVLADWQMPGMSGPRLARTLHEKGVPAKIILVTGALPPKGQMERYKERFVDSGILVGIALKGDESGIQDLLDQAAQRSEIRAEETAKQVWTELPQRDRGQAGIAEPIKGKTRPEQTGEILREVERNPAPVSLHGISTSSAGDKLFEWSGFTPVMTITDMKLFMIENERLGGGGVQGFRAVTEKITDGIWSLTAHAFHAVELAAAFFFPTALAQEAFDVAAAPATAHEQKRFEDARKVLLRSSVLGDSDVLILAPGIGVDLGAALLMRKIVGDTPVAVLVRNDTDRKFLDQINIKLRQANRPVIFAAATLIEAKGLLKNSRPDKEAHAVINIKPMISSTEQNQAAVLLLDQYKEAVITVTPQMFKNLLNLAGVSEVLTRLRDEYLATARSA